jgi:Ca2+/Na+ antiporter
MLFYIFVFSILYLILNKYFKHIIFHTNKLLLLLLYHCCLLYSLFTSSIQTTQNQRETEERSQRSEVLLKRSVST